MNITTKCQKHRHHTEARHKQTPLTTNASQSKVEIATSCLFLCKMIDKLLGDMDYFALFTHLCRIEFPILHNWVTQYSFQGLLGGFFSAVFKF